MEVDRLATHRDRLQYALERESAGPHIKPVPAGGSGSHPDAGQELLHILLSASGFNTITWLFSETISFSFITIICTV